MALGALSLPWRGGVSPLRLGRDPINKAQQSQVAISRFAQNGADAGTPGLLYYRLCGFPGKKNHGSSRQKAADKVSRFHAVHQRHLVIKDHDVGIESSRKLNRRSTICSFAANPPPGIFFDDLSHCLPQSSVVVRQ